MITLFLNSYRNIPKPLLVAGGSDKRVKRTENERAHTSKESRHRCKVNTAVNGTPSTQNAFQHTANSIAYIYTQAISFIHIIHGCKRALAITYYCLNQH